jgi:hypothetical protein
MGMPTRGQTMAAGQNGKISVTHILTRALLLSAGLIAAMPATAAVTIADSSFEQPATGSYIYAGSFSAPAGTLFVGGAGVQHNGSAWGFAGAPDGVQTAFLQNSASITLDVSGLTIGNSYEVLFMASRRPGYGLNPITVSWNGNALGAAIAPTSNGWLSYSGGTFVATAASGQVSFATALTAGHYDDDSGLDAISLSDLGAISSAVPEPASWAMMIGGFALIGSTMRRRATLAALRLA